jgi:hypothetical protein
MSSLKYVYRLQRIDDLIARRATGTPEAFAQRLGLCRSELMNCLSEMRQLGANIGYCRKRQSYYYPEGKRLFVGFVPPDQMGQSATAKK